MAAPLSPAQGKVPSLPTTNAAPFLFSILFLVSLHRCFFFIPQLFSLYIASVLFLLSWRLCTFFIEQLDQVWEGMFLFQRVACSRDEFSGGEHYFWSSSFASFMRLAMRSWSGFSFTVSLSYSVFIMLNSSCLAGGRLLILFWMVGHPGTVIVLIIVFCAVGVCVSERSERKPHPFFFRSKKALMSVGLFLGRSMVWSSYIGVPFLPHRGHFLALKFI